MKGQTSGSQLLATHFRNNAHNFTPDDSSAMSGVDVEGKVEGIMDSLIGALEMEGEVLSNTYQQLLNFTSKFHSMSVVDALNTLVVILSESVLESAKVVVDALVDILIALVDDVLDILKTKIHIPIISDILADIGIGSISYLDLFCWIAAVRYTVVYKIVEKEASFPSRDDVNRLLRASSGDELRMLFEPEVLTLVQAPTSQGIVAISRNLQHTVSIVGHSVAGFLILNSDFVNVSEAQTPPGEDSPFAIISAIVGIAAAGIQGGVNYIVQRDPLRNKAVIDVSITTTIAVIFFKGVYSGLGQGLLKKMGVKLKGVIPSGGRAVGAFVNSMLVIPGLFDSIWHFAELAKMDDNGDRSASIVEETSNLTSYVSRISYAVAVNDLEPDSKEIAVGIMAASNIVTGCLQTAEAVIKFNKSTGG